MLRHHDDQKAFRMLSLKRYDSLIASSVLEKKWKRSAVIRTGFEESTTHPDPVSTMLSWSAPGFAHPSGFIATYAARHVKATDHRTAPAG